MLPFIIDREAGDIIRLVASVCLFVCVFVGVFRASISLGFLIGCTFNSVAVSTGWAFAVDHALNEYLYIDWGDAKVTVVTFMKVFVNKNTDGWTDGQRLPNLLSPLLCCR